MVFVVTPSVQEAQVLHLVFTAPLARMGVVLVHGVILSVPQVARKLPWWRRWACPGQPTVSCRVGRPRRPVRNYQDKGPAGEKFGGAGCCSIVMARLVRASCRGTRAGGDGPACR